MTNGATERSQDETATRWCSRSIVRTFHAHKGVPLRLGILPLALLADLGIVEDPPPTEVANGGLWLHQRVVRGGVVYVATTSCVVRVTTERAFVGPEGSRMLSVSLRSVGNAESAVTLTCPPVPRDRVVPAYTRRPHPLRPMPPPCGLLLRPEVAFGTAPYPPPPPSPVVAFDGVAAQSAPGCSGYHRRVCTARLPLSTRFVGPVGTATNRKPLWGGF
jgi:hypothetical protein